jgi:hypothetical protein
MGCDQKKGKKGENPPKFHQNSTDLGYPRYNFRPPKNTPPRATIFNRRLQILQKL